MKANELRIGNILHPIHLEGYAEVIEIMVSGIGIQKHCDNTQKSLVLTGDLHRLEPIPLTKEILLKCGFERARGTEKEFAVLKCGLMNLNPLLTDKGNTYSIALECGWTDRRLKKGIIYLHQLQNLYFALTGEELNITL